VFGERGQLLESLDHILERTKVSKNADANMGLFGASPDLTALKLKSTPPLDLMGKLLLEYEVLKNFLSAHPFDGLYPYLKRDNFLSQLKATDNFGNFRITVMIKSIQRAKKKGFFLLVEDISDSLEFFLKETLDYQKFDILTIEGYKTKSLRVSKIIKRSIDELIADAQKA
jgi:DNA polymerase III alpha subunit